MLWIPVFGFGSLLGYCVSDSDHILLVFQNIRGPSNVYATRVYFLENRCNEKHSDVSKEKIEGKKLAFYHCPINEKVKKKTLLKNSCVV